MVVGKAFRAPGDFPETAKAFYQAIRPDFVPGCEPSAPADGEFRWHHAQVSLCAIGRDASSSGTACLLYR